MDAVQQFNQFRRLDDQPGFLPHLADHTVRERLAQFKQAAGQRPLAPQRLGSAPHQQNPALIHHHCAHACQRR